MRVAPATESPATTVAAASPAKLPPYQELIATAAATCSELPPETLLWFRDICEQEEVHNAADLRAVMTAASSDLQGSHPVESLGLLARLDQRTTEAGAAA